MNSEQFLGLSKKESQNLAEKYNLIFRLIRVDDRKMLPYPDDNRDDRVCIEIEKGSVVQATIQ